MSNRSMGVINDIGVRGDNAFVNYIDKNGRSVKGSCKVIGKHFLDGEPFYLITASSEVIDGVGRLVETIDNLAIVDPDELDFACRALTVAVDNTK